MHVFRIAKTGARAEDLSGTGACQYGGRWNSKGTYMLYTSENSSLAYLESLVHFDEMNVPPKLWITKIEISEKSGLILELPEDRYPKDWRKTDHLPNKLLGNDWIRSGKHLALKVRSAINPLELNYLINPLFPGCAGLLQIVSVTEISRDARLT